MNVRLMHLDGPGVVCGLETFCKVTGVVAKGDGAISFTCVDPDDPVKWAWRFAVHEVDVMHLFKPETEMHGDLDFVGCFFVLMTAGGLVHGRPTEDGDWAFPVANGGERMRCRICGKAFNPAHLDEVFEHEHNAALDPEAVAGIDGKKV